MLHVSLLFFVSFALALVPAVHIPDKNRRKACLDATKWWEAQLDAKYGLGKISEKDQDAKLMSLFQSDNLGTTNKFYVELGLNGLNISNTKRLKQEKQFTGFSVDIHCQDVPKEYNCHTLYITPEKIATIFKQYKAPRQPDYVSIDIDSTDVWIFTNLTSTFRPRVLTVKYNSDLPLERFWQIPKQLSLGAVNRAALQNKYSLVGVEPSQDAFLVRKDLICPGTEVPLPQFAKFTGLKFPHDGIPLNRQARGCKLGDECPVEWTLRDFPCNATKTPICSDSNSTSTN